jgi:hypothetical protein
VACGDDRATVTRDALRGQGADELVVGGVSAGHGRRSDDYCQRTEHHN